MKIDFLKWIWQNYIQQTLEILSAIIKPKEIYAKYRTSEFANYIKQNLNRDDLYIGYSFHNKKGTIDIVRNFEISQISIGIQIENNQYRYFMNIPNVSADIREKMASELFYNGYWFNDTQDTKRSTLYKEFCGYNPDFIYRYFQIDKHFGKELQEISYDEIANQINKDVLRLNENIVPILKIIQKINLQETNQFLEEVGIEPLEF